LCESAFEYDEFPFNQICVKAELTNEANYTIETYFTNETNLTNETYLTDTCPKYVNGTESTFIKETIDLDYFHSFWNYINKFSCVDYIEKTDYETNCDGFLIDSSEYK